MMVEKIGAVLLVVAECLALPFKLLWLWITSVLLFFAPTRFIAKDLKGQTVLITGSGGGLGSLMAERFAALGCQLILWDVNPSLNKKTAAKIERYGIHFLTDTVDLSCRDQIYKAVQKVKDEFGQVDILVNNAGVVFGNSVVNSQPDEMVKTMHVNCLAHYWTVQAFLPDMIARNNGHIVTIASSAGLVGVPGMADYCSSKFAVVGFEESLRLELMSTQKTGVKTTVACPFLIDTGMFAGCRARFPLIMDALQPDYVTDRIMDAVLREDELVLIPRLLYLMAVLKMILPVKCQYLLYDFFGVTQLMSTFAGSYTRVKVK